jgi:hypothetical protein
MNHVPGGKNNNKETASSDGDASDVDSAVDDDLTHDHGFAANVDRARGGLCK